MIYKCNKCGKSMHWDVNQNKLVCDCGSTEYTEFSNMSDATCDVCGYYIKDNFSILLDDNKFRVKNKSGTYYFKEITVGDINNQDNTIAVNMYTMTCCSFNRNYEEE